MALTAEPTVPGRRQPWSRIGAVLETGGTVHAGAGCRSRFEARCYAVASDVLRNGRSAPSFGLPRVRMEWDSPRVGSPASPATNDSAPLDVRVACLEREKLALVL